MKTIISISMYLFITLIGYTQQLQPVYKDDKYQITGVAISAKGRLFVTYPRWSDTYRFGVAEIMQDGSVRPYPDEETNNWHAGENGMNKWVCVQAVFIDDQDFLYVVDPAAPKLGKVYRESAKVVKFDLHTNKVVKTYRFPGTIDNQSYLNDIRVDTRKQMAYLTNSGTGGIVVLDLRSGLSWQVLQNNHSVHPDPAVHFIIDGKEFEKQGQRVLLQSDGIALSPDRNYLYYKSITDQRLFRIHTALLNDTTRNGLQLSAAVEDLGNFAYTDGMIFDKKGNLYLGDPTTYSIIKITPDLQKHVWITDRRLIWPDSYAISTDGYLYITTSQIQRAPDFNGGINKRTSPYMVFKTRLE